MKDKFELALMENQVAAAMKDWRLAAKTKKLRDIARQALKSPIVGTAREIGAKYGHLHELPRSWDSVGDHDAADIWLWAVHAEPLRRCRMYLIPVGLITD